MKTTKKPAPRKPATTHEGMQELRFTTADSRALVGYQNLGDAQGRAVWFDAKTGRLYGA